MKKLMSFLVILSFVLVLAGCNNEGTDPNDDNGGTGTGFDWNVEPGQWDPEIKEYRPEEDATLLLWVDDLDWADAVITEYNKLFPEVTVTAEKVGSVDTRANMTQAGPAGVGADVFVMPHDHMGAALQAQILGNVGMYYTELSTRVPEASIKTVTGTNESGDEIIYAFPISGESLALFYNNDVLDEIDDFTFDPDTTTFEDIIAYAENYVDYENEKYFILGDVGNSYDMHFIATSFGFELFGPDHNDPDQANLGSQAMKDALNWHRNQFRLRALNLESSSLSGDNIKTLFEEGKSAFIIDGPWSISRYEDAGLDFGVVKLPNLNGTQPITFSGNQLAAVSSYSKFPAAARTLANFMSTEAGAQIMYDETGRLPVLIDASGIEGLSDDPYLKGIQEQLAFSQPMPTIQEMGIFWDVSGTMYSNAWNATDDMTPADAADTGQQSYEDGRQNLDS